ncbi:MFS transporter [Pantoea sp. BAV 3049]|uniref:MFS transporter n=1 Tax=Pantoea sp. BAV 3049 TaxID=2654188 RepID=UPI00131E3951|nr:MFS transporter [Pantoea sp. BAV 3049]
MRASLKLGLTGFSLIAVTYGMARFAWGLMLPAVVKDIPFSTGTAGVISASSFAAYCLAITGAPILTERFGPRWLAAAAAILAAGGMLMLAFSFSPLMLAVGLFIAGLSPGVASPSLASAVSRRITGHQQPQMNTVINAGTSAGIILSVPVLLYLPGGWRAACLLFSVIALLCLLPVMLYLPDDRMKNRAERKTWRKRMPGPAMLRLMIIALVSGSTSAAWWSFGPQILRQQVGVNAQSVSLLWLIAGGAGIFGALTGPVADRIGMKQVYRISLLFMALPLAMLAWIQGPWWWFIPVVALCGAGYVTLSGVLLVCGAAANKNAPASGVGLVFLMLAAGQVAGSVLFGQLYALAGAAPALLMFCMLSLLVMLLNPVYGHTSRKSLLKQEKNGC